MSARQAIQICASKTLYRAKRGKASEALKPAAAATPAAITLPIRCVQQFTGGGQFVWVVEANQAKARRVTTGKTSGNRIVVTEGLKGGEKVIVDGWQKVGEGTPVAIR